MYTEYSFVLYHEIHSHVFIILCIYDEWIYYTISDLYNKHKAHTTVLNDSITNYIINNDLVIEIRDSIIYPFIIDTKNYKNMRMDFMIQNKTVFSIHNQEGEI
jgi:hypothetical protein